MIQIPAVSFLIRQVLLLWKMQSHITLANSDADRYQQIPKHIELGHININAPYNHNFGNKEAFHPLIRIAETVGHSHMH
jgi:hypothetical protein